MGNICTQKHKIQNQQINKRNHINQYSNHIPKTRIDQIKKLLCKNSTQIIYKSNKNKASKSINDFNVIRILGKGGFGKVVLAEDIKQEKLYAMKIIQKDSIQNLSEKQHALSERFILQSIEHPFIIHLHYAFQNTKKLFLLVDYMGGGQLFYLLRNKKKFSEEAAKFYAAQVLLALQYLHFKNIIYRDLKPQNILLDQKGHIKLVDFGLAKICLKENQTTYSICGTPEYIAPEILTGKGYTQAVDWFCFGSVIYDMVTGKPPFYSKNKNEIMKKLVSKQVPLPDYLSNDIKSLLKGLFQRNPQNRLGNRNGANQIKNHEFFKSIDFLKLMKKQIEPPVHFDQNEQINVNGFDAKLIMSPVYQSFQDNKQNNIENHYQGFTFSKQIVTSMPQK